MYLITSLLQRQGIVATAMTLLNECITVSESLPKDKEYLTRARFKLSELSEHDNSLKESQSSRNVARSLGRELLDE